MKQQTQAIMLKIDLTKSKLTYLLILTSGKHLRFCGVILGHA